MTMFSLCMVFCFFIVIITVGGVCVVHVWVYMHVSTSIVHMGWADNFWCQLSSPTLLRQGLLVVSYPP